MFVLSLEDQFIEGRAQALAFEARRFPLVFGCAFAWLNRARDQAEKRGALDLAASLEGYIHDLKKSRKKEPRHVL